MEIEDQQIKTLTSRLEATQLVVWAILRHLDDTSREAIEKLAKEQLGRGGIRALVNKVFE